MPGYVINKIIKSSPKSKKYSGQIPLHILKENELTHIDLSDCINMAFDSGSFFDTVK